MFKSVLYIIAVSLLPLFGGAQVFTDLDQGRLEYDRHNYQKAIKYLKRSARNANGNHEHYWLAKTFLAMGEPDSAQYYMERATQYPKPKAWLWYEYGRIALYNEDSAEVRRAFQEILTQEPDNKRALAQWDLINSPTLDSPRATVTRLPFNSRHSDFGGCPFGDGMLFSSERFNSLAGVKYSSSFSKSPLSDIYYVERRSENKWKRNPKVFSKTFNTRLHQGPVWISPDTSLIYFSRSNLNPGEYIAEESIWASRRVDGRWEPPTRQVSDLNDNAGLSYCITHPWVDLKNRLLYFSSDRGSRFGGMDIFVAPLDNPTWENARKLGPTVNGPGNEVFPTISSEGNLIFASNSHVGYGGLDLYILRTDDDGKEFLEHLPPPINSAKDDFAMYLEDSTLTGWFTSNRLQGGRDDDIYSFTLPPPPEPTLPPFTDCIPATSFDYCYTFYDEITGSDLPFGLYYQWDLGDGHTEKGIKVKHCFASTGTYQIRLLVTDSLTGEPVFNQASYELEIEYPYPLFINSQGSLDQPYTDFLAVNGKPDEIRIDAYYWSIGDGWEEGEEVYRITQPATDSLLIQLGVRGQDAQGNPFQQCVERTFYKADKGPISLTPNDSFPTGLPTDPGLAPGQTANPDPRSNPDMGKAKYRIQLGSSLEPLPQESPLYKKVPKVLEQYQNGVYRYLAPEKLPLDSALSLLPKYRSLGFKHPSVIKDRSEDPYFKENWLPGDLSEEITVTGKILDKNKVPIEGTILWENLRTGEVLMETQIGDSGHYQESLPKEIFYGYYIDLEGYYTVSHHLDLTNYACDIVIGQDLELISIEDMIRYQLPVKINNLFFDFDKSTIKNESYPELHRLVRFIQDHPELKFEIAGHTDNYGTEAYNLELSRLRAGEVGRYLVLSGCNPDQLEIRGAGEKEPVASNETAGGRRENRRVEFRIEKL